MSRSQQFTVNSDIGLDTIVNIFDQKLQAMGYQVRIYGNNSIYSSLNIQKDNTDLKKMLGLSSECNINLSKSNENIIMNIEDVWTNKILAVAIGWIFCLIPLITGIIGFARQSQMAGDMMTHFHASILDADTLYNR